MAAGTIHDANVIVIILFYLPYKSRLNGPV